MMTAAHVDESTCPACGATASVTLSAGRLCTECRHEWNPADIDWSTLRAVGPAAVSVVADSILGPPESVVADLTAQAVVDALVGARVRLEGGQAATIEELVDDDHVAVRLNDGRTEIIGWDVIESAIEVEPAGPVELDVSDETAEQLAATALAMAALMLRAGAMSVAETDDGPVLSMPAAGWLPDDTGIMPMVEQGVAYAIATLISAFALPADDVRAIAEQFLTSAETANDESENNA